MVCGCNNENKCALHRAEETRKEEAEALIKAHWPHTNQNRIKMKLQTFDGATKYQKEFELGVAHIKGYLPNPVLLRPVAQGKYRWEIVKYSS